MLYAALNMLTEKQKERIIKYYLQGLTLEKIAEDEGVYYKAISFSIESGLKKLKNFWKTTTKKTSPSPNK